MKTKILIPLLSLLFFSSCIVKSLQPFYTTDTISFERSFVGNWKDKANGEWSVVAFKDSIEPGEKIELPDDISADFKVDLIVQIEGSYLVSYTKDDKPVQFIAVPFKIGGQLFLDFSLFLYENDGANSLASKHLIETHSVAKLDMLDDDKISMKWLDETRLEELFKEDKLKIEHQKTGSLSDSFVLTAKPKELQAFLKKYMNSDNQDKWSTDVKYTLSRTTDDNPQ